MASGRSHLYGPHLIAPEEVAVIRNRAPGRLRSGPTAAITHAILDVEGTPFDDVRVRRALNLAVDRGHVAQRIGGADVATPTCQLLPPGLAGHRPICPFTARATRSGAWIAPDLDTARRLVRASGKSGTAVSVWTPPDRTVVGEHLAAVLRDLGFRARVRRVAHDGVIFEAAFGPGPHPQIGVTGWIAEHPGPERFLRDLIACGQNPSHFCDRGIERAIDRAADGEAGDDAWAAIETRIARQAPIVPLYSLRWTVAASATAGNVQITPLFGVLFDQVWVR